MTEAEKIYIKETLRLITNEIHKIIEKDLEDEKALNVYSRCDSEYSKAQSVVAKYDRDINSKYLNKLHKMQDFIGNMLLADSTSTQ